MENITKLCLRCKVSISHGCRKYCGARCRIAQQNSDNKQYKTEWYQNHKVLVPRVTQICLWCSTPINDSKRADTKFCDELCASRYRRGYVCKTTRECLSCHAVMPRNKPLRALHCSYECWYRDNRENLNSYLREYRENKPEIVKAITKRYRDKRPLPRLLERYRRRHKETLNGIFHVTSKDINRLLNRHNYKCFYCGQDDKPLQLDHVIPIAKGGRTSIGNLIPSCSHCNQSKNDSYITTWKNPPAKVKPFVTKKTPRH